MGVGRAAGRAATSALRHGCAARRNVEPLHLVVPGSLVAIKFCETNKSKIHAKQKLEKKTEEIDELGGSATVLPRRVRETKFEIMPLS